MEKAIIGYGQYRLHPQCFYFTITEENWFKMSLVQWLQHIKKFNTAMVHGSHQSVIATVSTATASIASNSCELSLSASDQDIAIGRSGTTSISLSVALNDGLTKVKLPHSTVKDIWKKAASLVSETNAIVSAPGFRQNGEIKIRISSPLSKSFRLQVPV